MINTTTTDVTANASTATIMREVMQALVPGTLIMILYFGPGVAQNLLISVCAALVTEAAVLVLRQRAVLATLGDGSAALAGWLLALTLPPDLPWAITAFGTASALLLGKHLYGGLGQNPFNPAMVGYAVLIVSFPTQMTAWTAPAETLSFSNFTGEWDAVTRATPLDQLRSAGADTTARRSVLNDHSLFGTLGARAWQWINLGFLCGGLWLLSRKRIDWRIPVALLGTLGLLSTLDFLISETALSPWSALFSGAAMLGAFFIATDPVSAATSRSGRWIYAAGIGALVFVIRRWSAYPEGIAFAVLLMNATAPLIDYCCNRLAASTRQ